MTDEFQVLVKFMALPEMLGIYIIYIIHSVIDIDKRQLEIELLPKTVQIKEMFRPT
jgi:hypothetical protein